MTKPEYKTWKENFTDAYNEAQKLSNRDIQTALQQRSALHSWFVKAYETVLAERKNQTR